MQELCVSWNLDTLAFFPAHNLLLLRSQSNTKKNYINKMLYYVLQNFYGSNRAYLVNSFSLLIFLCITILYRHTCNRNLISCHFWFPYCVPFLCIRYCMLGGICMSSHCVQILCIIWSTYFYCMHFTTGIVLLRV